MKNLILPVAGKSSRFPEMRPKWILSMPDGLLMLEKSIENLDVKKIYDNVVIICLKEHIDQYISPNVLKNSFEKNYGIRPKLAILDKPTSSQSESVYLGLKKAKVKGSIFIKDCDNTFSFKFEGKNQVAVIDLNQQGLVDAKSYSYVKVDKLGFINNIVEKNVIGNLFCCGGYGFEDVKDFYKSYESIKSKEEVYISHVIFSLLLKGERFKAKEASLYQSWETLREYRSYQRKYLTLFADVDGVLLENGSKFSKGGWKTPVIQENIEAIKELSEKCDLHLVITTSRPESEKEYLLRALNKKGVFPDACLFGLPHCKRVLLNDFTSTNPYPTAISINIERNSKKLRAHLLGLNVVE